MIYESMLPTKELTKEALIGVLMGGPGSEREVSLASGRAVLKALQEAGYNAIEVDVKERDQALPERLELAFNLIHGTYGEDGGLQAYLEEQGVPYTGTGIESSRIGFDKVLSKQEFLNAGVPTPQSQTLLTKEGAEAVEFDLPYVVKPPREGSSVGVHVCKTEEEAQAAFADVAQYSEDVLVEQFVAGKELTVAIVGEEVMPIVHIDPSGEFYDISSKYSWLAEPDDPTVTTQYHCPADLDEETTAKVQAAAKAAYDSLDTEIYARVDVLLDSLGNPYILEINTIPGMTETSLLPKAAKASGYSFAELCVRIGELSLGLRATGK